MSKFSYFTPEITKKIRDAFVERWQADPENVPLCKKEIQDIIFSIDPKRTITSIKGDCPHVQVEIEKHCRTKFKGLPPVLGARGVLVRRNVDGSPAAKVARHPNNTRGGVKSTTGNLNGDAPKKPTVFSNPQDIEMPPIDPRNLPRTRWNDQEQGKLQYHWVKLWSESPEKGLNVENFSKAMHIALEEKRWRKITTLSALPDGLYLNTMIQVEGIVRRGIAPPEVVTQEKEVTVPYNPEKVLMEVSIPTLAAVLARREAEEKQMFYAMLASKLGAPKAPTENLADRGVDRASIEALLPRVQVFGFKPTQHAAMLVAFKDKPIRFAPSVAPEASLEPSRIMANCDMYIVDGGADNMKPWWEMLVANVPYEKREKVHSASRVLDHVKHIAGDWMSRHSDITQKWRAIHVAAPASNGHHQNGGVA